MHDEGRFWVQIIEGRVLRDYMKYRSMSVRALAAEVNRELAREGIKDAKSVGIIGHLRSGKRTTCRPETAKAIERALQAPPGSIFVPQVSRVSRPDRTAA